MAGLLDLFNTDEGMQGLGLLSAAAPSMAPMNLTGRFAQAGHSYKSLQEEQLKQQYVKSQIAENSAQSDMRKQQLMLSMREMDTQDQMLGTGKWSPQAAPSAPPSAAGQPSTPGAIGAPAELSMPQSLGSPLTPQQQAAVAQLPPAPPHVQSKLDEISAKYQIPIEALKLDVAFNKGKGIAEMVNKRGSPDMQVSNGYAYDKNALGAGFMPSLTTSQSGQTSMTRIGPDGMPVVSAPKGALETFGDYQRATEGTKAAFDPLTVTPQGGRPVMSTRGAVVQSMGAPRPGFGAPNGDQFAILSQELARAQAQGNGDLVAGLQREIARLPKGSDTAASSSGLAGIPLQSEAEKTSQIDTAKADVVRDTGRLVDGKRYGQLTTGVDRAIELLKKGPTASGFGSMLDRTANFVGASTPGADAASQLDTLSGWLMSNVPRMEGPQSDKDVANYRIMAAEVGDRTKPVSQRMKAAEELKSLQAKYAQANGVVAPTGGVTASFDAPKSAPPSPMKGMVRGGYKFKGGDASNPANWEKQ
jgi:hypothetical protein